MEIITLNDLNNQLTKIVLLSVGALLFATLLTPFYTYLAYRHKFWKKQRSNTISGAAAEVLIKLHAAKFRRNIPTMAGAISVIAIAVVTLAFNLDREQTWLPLAALIAGGAVGLIDDIINVRGDGSGVGGLRSWIKFSLITIVGAIGAWFFFSKLGYDTMQVPLVGDLALGWLIVPLFILAVVSTSNAVNISDGLDGLAGGLLIMAFGAFGFIALLQGNAGIAGFCFTVVGALLSYTWFNIYPARFFMGDVGSFAFGTSLGVVAMLTDAILLLPLIGLVFVAEAGSSLLQITSRRLFKRRIFKSAPIHHHLEASGWPEPKVTMRFWVIGGISAFMGLLVALAGGFIN